MRAAPASSRAAHLPVAKCNEEREADEGWQRPATQTLFSNRPQHVTAPALNRYLSKINHGDASFLGLVAVLQGMSIDLRKRKSTMAMSGVSAPHSTTCTQTAGS